MKPDDLEEEMRGHIEERAAELMLGGLRTRRARPGSARVRQHDVAGRARA